MFVVSYVIILAFHPTLKMDRVIIQSSFRHSLQQLTTIDYLKNDQMSFVNIKLIKQLKDSVLEVSRKKYKNAIAQMLSIELCLGKKDILAWFNKKLNRNI